MFYLRLTSRFRLGSGAGHNLDVWLALTNTNFDQVCSPGEAGAREGRHVAAEHAEIRPGAPPAGPQPQPEDGFRIRHERPAQLGTTMLDTPLGGLDT